jgi:curved DNA-binding protein CbpA
MARSNHDDFDGYRKWLGITNKKRLPTHYELLGISLDEDDPEVIHAAAEQRRRFVESKRGDGHDGVVTEILYRISEAETTLLNNEMRRGYDRQLEALPETAEESSDRSTRFSFPRSISTGTNSWRRHWFRQHFRWDLGGVLRSDCSHDMVQFSVAVV